MRIFKIYNPYRSDHRRLDRYWELNSWVELFDLDSCSGLENLAQSLQEGLEFILGVTLHETNISASTLKIAAQNGLHQSVRSNFNGNSADRDLLQT